MPDHLPDLPDDVSPAGRDLRAYTDALRQRHAVVHNDRDEWVLLRHADVVRAACDPRRYSSRVSGHLQIPNGLDGARHAAMRRLIDPYFTADALRGAAAAAARVAAALVADLPDGVPVDAVADVGARYAVRAQCAWLGWPEALEPELLDWIDANHAASRAGDRERLAQVAADFDAIIRSVLEPRRGRAADAGADVTTRLMHERVDGRALQDDEIVSILRNWTGGDLGSMALCVGVVCHHLAQHPALQASLRADGVDDAMLDAAIDEMLRIDDPFVSNRRVTTEAVVVAGVPLPAGAKVKLHWTSANRDEAVFGAVDRHDPAAHARDNLVYGIGPHVCPGRPLATLQLRAITRALLARGGWQLAPGVEAEREVSPVGGFRVVPIVLEAHGGGRDAGAIAPA